MPTVYQVTVSPTEKENLFHITWYNEQTREEKSFKQSAAEITEAEIERLSGIFFYLTFLKFAYKINPNEQKWKKQEMSY